MNGLVIFSLYVVISRIGSVYEEVRHVLQFVNPVTFTR